MEHRRPLIAGNWKMYKTPDEAAETARQLVERVAGVTDVDIMIAPTFTALAPVFEVIQNSPVALGAQNLFWENEGAYTGEISAAMLKSVGCRYCIIGHSERRQYFGETDETVNKKIQAAIQVGLKPVFCVGETEKERESEQTLSVLDKQVKKGLEGLLSDQLDMLIIAYEPVWAIGNRQNRHRCSSPGGPSVYPISGGEKFWQCAVRFHQDFIRRQCQTGQYCGLNVYAGY